MIARSLFAAAVVAAASVAEAAPPQAPDTGSAETAEGASAEASSAAEDEERKICRTERVTGSLTRRTRLCLTQAQWREVHDRTRRGVDELVGGASGAPRCTSAMDVACGAPDASGVAPGM